MSLAPDRAPGLVIADGVDLPADTVVGAHVVIHAGTTIGPGCFLGDHAVLGKPPRLAARSAAAGAVVDEPLVLGAGVAVCTAAVVFAGARVADGAIIGDQSHVRERTRIGAGTVIGRGSAIDNDVVIGDRVRVQTDVYVTAFSLVEDDVFLGPKAMTTNDDVMARHAPGHRLEGATLRRACRVGGGAVLVPGVEIGEEAFVAAGAVVTRDVPARTAVMGVPARAFREVGEEELLERWL